MKPSPRLNRRTLLAGAALLPVAAPRASGAAPSGSDAARLGFIGVKNRGLQNLAPLISQCVAVCDVDRSVLAEARARVEAKNGKTCASYSDYRKLLEDKNVDAVVISTPDHWHALQTIHACEAGKDVFCEKPLSLTVVEGRKMVEAARRTGRVVQTGSQQRSDAKFRQACELVRSGALGKLRLARVGLPGVNFNVTPVPDSEPPSELDYEFWLGPAPFRPYNKNRVHYNFRFFWDYSGGQMTNFGAHHLDIAQWALGMDDSGPVAAEGKGIFNPEKGYEVPSTFDVTYTYANGVQVLCGSGPNYRVGVTFEGEKGSLFVTRGRIEATPAEILKVEPAVRLEVSTDHYRNWLDCLRTRNRPICDVEIGHRSATVCHLGIIAIRTGRKVVWDPKAERITNDAELAAMTVRPYRAPWRL